MVWVHISLACYVLCIGALLLNHKNVWLLGLFSVIVGLAHLCVTFILVINGVKL